jgi:hypothetical protein
MGGNKEIDSSEVKLADRVYHDAHRDVAMESMRSNGSCIQHVDVTFSPPPSFI